MSLPSVVNSSPICFRLPSLILAVVFCAKLTQDDLLKSLLFVYFKITGILFSIPEPDLHWGVGVRVWLLQIIVRDCEPLHNTL